MYNKSKNKHKKQKQKKKSEIETLLVEIEKLINTLSSDALASDMHWLDLDI